LKRNFRPPVSKKFDPGKNQKIGLKIDMSLKFFIATAKPANGVRKSYTVMLRKIVFDQVVTTKF